MAAIEETSREFIKAFDAQDAKGVAALWTVDGAYQNADGVLFRGREEIEKEYASLFRQNPNAKIRLSIDSLRLLSGGAAVEDGTASIESPASATPGVGKYVAIHVKVDGKWLMSEVRDSRVATSVAADNVADLEWLIGEWSAEEHGATTTSVCRWIADKSFLERTYSTTKADGTTTSGVQLIGWNHSAGHMQSWTFSSGGGHAVGVWSPVEGGWLAHVQGITPEGVSTDAVNRLRKLDDNAYVWQSIDRTVGGQPLPDTDEVVMKRQPAKR